MTLEFSRGSNAGQAIYLCETEEDGSGCGHRIAGPKCWGTVEQVAVFEMSESDLTDMIREAKRLLKRMRRNKK